MLCMRAAREGTLRLVSGMWYVLLLDAYSSAILHILTKITVMSEKVMEVT